MLSGARVLLTGATGRVGRVLTAELVRSGCEVVLIVRAPSPEAARARAASVLGAEADFRQLTVFCGDVTQPSFGLPRRERARLRASTDVVVHAAAATSFKSSLEDARLVNVHATSNALDFAERMPRLLRFGYVSTAFVAGKRIGRVLEAELEHDFGFQNAYQQSKYEAEVLVHGRRDALPIVVLRPAIVLERPEPVPHRLPRSAFRFAFELVRRSLLPALPGSASTAVDLLTEGDAARAAVKLLARSNASDVYHVAAGSRALTLGAIVEPYGVRFLAEEQFAWELAKWRREKPRLAPLYDELSTFIYDLAYPKVFDTRDAEAALDGPVTAEDPLVLLHGSGVLAGHGREAVRA